MRRVSALLGAAVVLLWATSAYAQKTNFAGTWVREAPAGGAAAGGGGGRGGGGGGPQARAGVYKVTLSVGGKEIQSQNVRVLEDIWLNQR